MRFARRRRSYSSTETAVCVGVRLEPDGAMTIAAPHGLDDLL
ncbi:MAG: Nucleotidyltransferase, partial [Thermoleophilaceae bacterium]|nr:Nucleotidyltransferase [Thermoleophilaceae bacterium]